MKRVVLLFWFTIVVGFVLSPIVAIGAEIARGTPFASAVEQWFSHLFQPGYNEFLLALIGALPFLAAAVFMLFHLTAAEVPRGRWAGVGGAMFAGAGLTMWSLTAIRMSRSSTAAIGYLFLPFESAFAMLIGYCAGRLIAKVRSS